MLHWSLARKRIIVFVQRWPFIGKVQTASDRICRKDGLIDKLVTLTQLVTQNWKFVELGLPFDGISMKSTRA